MMNDQPMHHMFMTLKVAFSTKFDVWPLWKTCFCDKSF